MKRTDIEVEAFNFFKKEAIKEYGDELENKNKAKLVNFLYYKILDRDKFEDYQNYNRMMQIDRFDDNPHDFNDIKKMRDVVASVVNFFPDEFLNKFDENGNKKPKEIKTKNIEINKKLIANYKEVKEDGSLVDLKPSKKGLKL